MQRVDYVIAGLAALALVGSVIGVMWYESPETTRYDVNVSEGEGSDDVWSTTLSGADGSGDETWTLDQQNITQIDFIVEISSSPTVRTDDTAVRIVITSPGGEERTVNLELTGMGPDDAEETVTVEIHTTPQSLERISAQNRTEAVAMIETGLNGTGEWNLSAEITAGGTQGPLGLEDEDVSLDIRAEYRFYQAIARAHVPDISPAG